MPTRSATRPSWPRWSPRWTTSRADAPYLGLGAAWFDTEHTAFGIDFGTSVGDRLNRLDEAVELIRAMLPGGPATARGIFYHAKDVRNDPPPVQARLPILIGGGGEKKTLQTVARYADAWNISMVTPPQAKEKNDILDRWCAEVGRDPSEIERTISLGPIVIRDDPAEAKRVIATFKERNPDMKREVVVLSGAADDGARPGVLRRRLHARDLPPRGRPTTRRPSSGSRRRSVPPSLDASD